MRGDKIIDENYLARIRAMPCLVGNKHCRPPVDPDHLIARGTEEHKRNDYLAVPLCRFHHRQRQDKGMIWFNAHHGVDLAMEALFSVIDYMVETRK